MSNQLSSTLAPLETRATYRRDEDVLGLQILGEHLKPVVGGEAPHQLLAESVREAREVGRLADTAEDRTDEHHGRATGTHSAVTATMPVWVQSPYARGCSRRARWREGCPPRSSRRAWGSASDEERVAERGGGELLATDATDRRGSVPSSRQEG